MATHEEEDWPYEKIEVVDPEDKPTWVCPEQKCTCAEAEHAPEPFTFSVMLCKPNGERMPGARVRVVVNGILANEAKANADGSGWITVELERKPDTVQVEWAPGETPIRPDLPYRKRYYVDLADDDPNEAARRRLHNLGFTFFDSLKQNIEDFQVEYEQPKVTGDVADALGPLRAFHDGASPPITPEPKDPSKERPGDPSPRGFQLVGSEAAGQPQNNQLQAPPPPPGAAGPMGTVKPPLARQMNLVSILDIVDQGRQQFEWIAVQTSDGGFDAIFWVFKDGLKDKQTGRRWPNSPHEQQLVCEKIKSKPSDLPGWPDGVSATGDEECLFLTPKLSDLRWAQAEKAGQAIEPRPQNVNGDQAVENDKMNKAVDKQMQSGWTAADPGKIWAIANRMATKKIAGLPAAINYGWHLQTSKVSVAKGNPKDGTWNGAQVKQAVTAAGQWCVQWEEMGHNSAWIDYSQLCILASGWCVTRTTGTTAWAAERTADVYTKKGALVAADGQNLTITKQPVPTLPSEKKSALEQNRIEREVAERRFRLARIEERKQKDQELQNTA